MAFTGDAASLWTGEAHLGDPLFQADDEYGVLSITKTFTEALVLREAAAGHIDLDARMPAIAGLNLEDDSPVVTPRMLPQHTSGLENYPKAIGYDPSRPITPRKIVSLALHGPLLAPPGRQLLADVPCPADRDGARRPAGLLQTVAHGGFFFFPDHDLVVVVHYEPTGTAAADALASALDDVLGGPPTG